MADSGSNLLPPSPTFPWFALRVRANHERLVSNQLRERGFDEFAPANVVERHWSDRKKKIERFLFPGYVFCRFNPNDRLPVLIVPGVVDCLGFGKVPHPVSEAEIDHVRCLVRSGLAVSPWPYLKEGDHVLIERGPLAGISGILLRKKTQYRIVVSIELLQRSVSAEIDMEWIRPVRAPSSPRLHP